MTIKYHKCDIVTKASSANVFVNLKVVRFLVEYQLKTSQLVIVY